MIPVRESLRTGWRLVRATPARSAIIAAAIAAPIGLATFASVHQWDGSQGLVWGAAAVAIAVVAVAQSSPEPIRASSTRAWADAGASARAAPLPGRVAGLIVAWAGLGAGVAVGVVVSGLGDHRVNRGPILTTGIVVAVVLAMVAETVPSGRTRPRRTRATVLTVLQWTVGLPVLVLGAIGLAGAITTDSDARFAIPTVMLLVTLAILTVLRPLIWLAGRAAGTLPPLRPIETAATTHRAAGLVTGVITFAMLVAFTVTILGASVAERGNPYSAVLADIAALPLVPPNVAVLEPSAPPPAAGGDDPAAIATLQLVDSLHRQVPSATVTATTEVFGGMAETLGPLCSSGAPAECRTVAADPALGSIPGLDLDQGAPSLFGGGRVGDLLEGWEAGAPLPPASWYGLDLLVLPEHVVETQGVSRRPGPIFVTHPTAFGAEDRARIRVIASAVAGSSGAGVTVITSEDRTGPVGGWRPGEVPWAPTEPGTRWLWTAMAAASALITAVATAVIAAHDRKATNRRLELLGATPGEVRGALALHTGLLLGLSALLAGAATLYLARFGLDRFNSAKPRLAIPFTVPVLPMLVLLVGVPLLATALAAVVARQRPSHPRYRGAARHMIVT